MTVVLTPNTPDSRVKSLAFDATVVVSMPVSKQVSFPCRISFFADYLTGWWVV